MKTIYGKAKVRSYKDKGKLLSLDPDLRLIMANSRDPLELEYYWTQWRAETGHKFRDEYLEYIDLANEAARLNGFQSAAEMQFWKYESNIFEEEMANTWEDLRPLYQELHAYVRYKLLKKYGEDLIDPEGPIPAQLLGNMWAQTWTSLQDILRPYPEKPDIDVSEEMTKQNWTEKLMFQKADEFFQSIGFDPMQEV